MLIKYVHWSEPETEKIHDTEKALKNNPFINETQEEFDAFTLEKFAKDKDGGLILSYEIIKGR
jgi:hypothetical protein